MPGPGSMHWRYGGEVRGYLLLVKAGLLQLMHPGLGAGVEQRADELEALWRRESRYEPALPAGEVELLLAGWHDAVRRTLA